jgi:uncharacterized membrane protein
VHLQVQLVHVVGQCFHLKGIMSLNIQDLIGGSITEGVAKIISLFKVDPTIAMEKQVELQEIALKMTADAAVAVAAQVQGQIDTNVAEAKSGDKYTARWRPTVGYICGAALASNYVIGPFCTWISGLAGHPNVSYPTLDLSVMTPILLGMLGLAGAHAYENVSSGVAAEGNDALPATKKNGGK